MYRDRLIILLVLFVSSVLLTKSSSSTKSWVSGVESLDKIEQSARISACDMCCELFTDAWSVDISQKHMDKILKQVEKEKCRTLFSKNIAEVSNLYFVKHIKPGVSYQQLILDLMTEYFPEKMDLVQVTIDYASWSYEYLIGRLHKKKELTIDDICYVMEQLPYYMKTGLSLTKLYALKPSYDMWMAFVKAVQKGMKEQSKEVQLYFVKNVEDFIQDSELKKCFESFQSIDTSRGEIIKKSAKKGVSDTMLKSYEKSVDKLLAHLKKLLAKHVDKKNKSAKLLDMVEKLLTV